MRGLPGDWSADDGNVGIIPARAGFTPRASSTRPPRRDHPRSRGVYRDQWNSWKGGYGSSPLARGLLEDHEGVRGGQGIIPARAGFTVTFDDLISTSRDHPRSRGVYDVWTTYHHLVKGSSPLARGLPHRHPRRRPRNRIIPARAGFTVYTAMGAFITADHPRSRGVYRLHHVLQRREARIIPARAGFTPVGQRKK